MNSQFDIFCDLVNQEVRFPEADFITYKEIVRRAMLQAGYALTCPSLEAPSLPKRSKKRDINKPAKLNGYTLFSKELATRRKIEKEECKASGKEFVGGNHFTILSAEWKKLTDQEKETWKINADKVNIENGYEVKARPNKEIPKEQIPKKKAPKNKLPKEPVVEDEEDEEQEDVDFPSDE